MARINEIVDRVQQNFPGVDTSLLQKSYVYSAKVHQGQLRLSGEPYLTHPLAVAEILAEMRLDPLTVTVGLLHDTVEDTLTSEEELREQFGEEITALVGGLTKISKIEFSSREEQQAENFRKMLLAMSKDIRIILIKLADRLHNMRTLRYMDEDSRRRISQETLDIYAPLAHRLGIYWMKVELEGRAFRELYPEVYGEIDRRIQGTKREREQYVDEVRSRLSALLDKQGLRAEVTGRLKEVYSFYRKMAEQELEFGEIYDLIAFRVIVDGTSATCYETLGLVHSMWKPVPGRIKDYIAIPRPNLYQSLHTSVIGRNGQPFEIQIRTHEMHRIAEEGIAAHWKYKEGKLGVVEGEEQFRWLRQLIESQNEVSDPREFLTSLKVNLYPDEVYCFTPRGEVKEFPRGATPVDFAYSIHSDIGHRCIGAKVGGRLVPLKYQLKSGDSVEIMTSPNHQPSKDWLKFVKTSRAQTKIRQWIKKEQRERSISLGREICEKECRKFTLNFSKLVKSEKMQKIASDFGFQAVDDLMASVGYGKISPKQIIGKLVPPEKLAAGDKKKESRIEKIVHLVKKGSQDAIKIKGVDDMMVRIASCCNPLPGDMITGFITRGRGITIHTADCSNV